VTCRFVLSFWFVKYGFLYFVVIVTFMTNEMFNVQFELLAVSKFPSRVDNGFSAISRPTLN